jgi:outer membrane protein assembly factor BamB
VTALAVTDGSTRWSHPLEQRYLSGPVIIDDTVIVVGAYAAYGQARADGSERWRSAISGMPHPSPGLVVDTAKRILVGGDDGHIRLLDHSDGHVLMALDVLPFAQGSKAFASALRNLGACPAPMPAEGCVYVTSGCGWFGAIAVPGMLPEVATSLDGPAGDG